MLTPNLPAPKSTNSSAVDWGKSGIFSVFRKPQNQMDEDIVDDPNAPDIVSPQNSHSNEEAMHSAPIAIPQDFHLMHPSDQDLGQEDHRRLMRNFVNLTSGHYPKVRDTAPHTESLQDPWGNAERYFEDANCWNTAYKGEVLQRYYREAISRLDINFFDENRISFEFPINPNADWHHLTVNGTHPREFWK